MPFAHAIRSGRVGGWICLALFWAGLLGCAEVNGLDAESRSHASATHAAKTGVLLVSHGSRSPQWQRMLLDFHDDVSPRIVALPGVGGVKSAFMEYSQPSIAAQLKAFDEEGYDDVILVPLLLTVSSHSFDDIPTIIGAKDDAKSLLSLQTDGIERYTPRARVSITPLLEFSSLLHENLPRRIAALSKLPSREGVVLVAYGDESYLQEWEEFFGRLDQFVREKTGVAAVRHCWCGHVVHYSKAPTVETIRGVLSQHDRAIVIPVLVARDSMFQDQIIGGAVEEVGEKSRVAYVPDAVLPDPTLNNWVVTSVERTLADLAAQRAPAREKQP